MRSVCSAALCLAAVVFVLVASSAPVLAQTGSIQVTVYEVLEDGERELLVGARVILSHVDKQYPDTAQITNMNGQATFPMVPVGSGYIVAVSMPGYGQVRDQVKVVSNQVQQVVLAMQEEIIEEVRVIADGDVIELEGAETTTTISDEFLADLPVMGRDYQNVLSLAPGVNDDDGDGNPNVHGSRERDFQMAVDGVSNVDPLTGEFQSYINPDSIEEIEIVDTGADASYGGAVGGFGKIITKTGSNEYEGTFNFFFRDSAFDNDGGGGRDPLDFGLIQPSILFSGPIVKDHVWFFLSHEYIDGKFPLDLVGGSSFVQRQKSFRHSDKITWQVTPKNRLQFQFSADPLEFSPAAVSSVAPPSSGVFYEQGGPTYNVKWTAPFTPNFFWEATVAFSDIERDWYPYDPQAVNTCVNDPNRPELNNLLCQDQDRGGLRSGPYFQDYQDTRQRWTYRADAEQFISDFLGGDHRLKFGTSLERVHFERQDERRDRLFLQRFGGASQFSIGGPQGSIPRAALTTQISSPVLSNTEARGNYYAAYISDSFTPRPNLNVVLGLRVSREEISSNGYEPFDPAGQRAAGNVFLAECGGSGFSAQQCFTGLNGHQLFTVHPDDVPTIDGCTLVNNRWQCDALEPAALFGRPISIRGTDVFDIVNNNIEPRFSISWDPWDDGKTKIAGNWGRFYGNTILAPITDEAGPARTNRVQNLDERGRVISISNAIDSAYTVSLIDRDLSRQYMDEWAVSVEREVAPETSVRLRYLNREYNDQLQDIDLNHVPVTWEQALADFPRALEVCEQIGEYADCTGERRLVPQGQGVAIVDSPDGVPDLQVSSPFFNNVYLVGNFNETTYKAFIAELTRRYYQNWEMQASYTFSKAQGNAEDYNQGLGDDATNIDDEYGYLGYDVRHLVKINGRVYIPVWGGFRIGGAVSWQSGYPYSIIEVRNVTDFPTNLGRGASGTDYNTFGRLTFQTVSPRVRYVTGQRNDQRNEPIWDFNVNFQKEFHIKDTRVTAQFDIFNLLNDTSLIITSIQQVEYKTRSGEDVIERFPTAVRRQGRQFQLSLKVNF